MDYTWFNDAKRFLPLNCQAEKFRVVTNDIPPTTENISSKHRVHEPLDKSQGGSGITVCFAGDALENHP